MRLEEEAEEIRKNAKKGVKLNNAMEEPLAKTEEELVSHMTAIGNAVGVCKSYHTEFYDLVLVYLLSSTWNICHHFRPVRSGGSLAPNVLARVLIGLS
jgi:hypothetical protein